MMKQRIIWFQDGVKLRNPPSKWGLIDVLTKRLISLIGNEASDHIILDPEKAIQELFKQLNLKEFSSVIDMTGLLKERVKHFSEDIQITNVLHLSRVRVASSPKMDGGGFVTSLTPTQIENLKMTLDLSRPLFLDDVSWSGRTAVITAKILSAKVECSTFGFLAVNCGDFGEGKPGAKQLLENMGGNVVGGHAITTPWDDGFHLIDFFNSPLIDRSDVFDIVIKIQELRERVTQSDENEKKSIEKEVKNILETGRELLFPNSWDTSTMIQIQGEGRLLASRGFNKDAFFCINPLNWLMPSFSRRIKVDTLSRNKYEIIETLAELRSITNREISWEVNQESEKTLSHLRGLERM